MDGARGAREKNLTFRETIRVQPCIRPLDAAVLAAGPDVCGFREQAAHDSGMMSPTIPR
jgi:hypothetical protein